MRRVQIGITSVPPRVASRLICAANADVAGIVHSGNRPVSHSGNCGYGTVFWSRMNQSLRSEYGTKRGVLA